MPLEFKTFTAVRLHQLNIRMENHGDGLSPAVDMKCSVEVPNTKLAEIDKELLPMFYKPVETEEEKAAQGELPNVPNKSSMPLLRSHSLAPAFPLGIEYSGYQMTVDRGLGEKSNLVLAECKLNKVTITPKEGGTVQLGFRVQASMVGDDVVGKLSSYIKADMHVALSPPTVKQDAIDGTKPITGDSVLDAGKKSGVTPVVKGGRKPAAKKSAPNSDEIAKAFTENEKAGKNKPASAVPKPPAKKRAKKPAAAAA